MSSNAELFLGDSYEVVKTFPENSVDALITDPPYPVYFDQNNNKNEDVEGFYLDHWDIELHEIYTMSLAAVRDGGFVCVTQPPQMLKFIPQIFGDLKDLTTGIIVNGWGYRHQGEVMRCYDYLVMGYKGHSPLNHTGTPKDLYQNCLVEALEDGEWERHEKEMGGYPYPRNSTDWEEVMADWMPEEGQIVLDPFMGSGVIGKACLRSGNHYRGIEMDAEVYEQAYAGMVQQYLSRVEKNNMEPELQSV